MQLANQLNAMEVGVILLVPVLLAVCARTKHLLRRFGTHTEGAVTVEFAIVISALLLIVAGIMDFGHAWYMQQAITNASREGARYGITYRTDTNGKRIAPSALSPRSATTCSQTISYNHSARRRSTNVSPWGELVSTPANLGTPLEVTVTATKTWFIVSSFIPGLGNTKTLRASTVMLCE